MILSAKRNAKTSFDLIDENGDPVAHVTTTSDGERLEDIIRAVNLYDYHDRLVEALGRALNCMEMDAEKIELECGCGRSIEELDRDGDLPEEILQARTILQELEGEL